MRHAGERASIPRVTGSIRVRQAPPEALGDRQAAAPWGRLSGLLSGSTRRDEAALDSQLAAAATVSRVNVIAVLSPKGGVGKTTCTFVLGDLLAGATGLRCVALDTNPDFGTLADLSPSASRAPRSVADVFAEMDEIGSAAHLRPFVSALPSGLHLIAAHPRAEVMAAVTPELHALLLDFLGRFYDVILMDLGTGVATPQAQFALERADQSVLVSTPDFAALSTVLDAQRYLPDHPVTLALNQVAGRPDDAARREVERELHGQGIDRHVILPYDDRLRTMLDSATYALGSLDRATRTAIKELGVAAAERLS